MGQSPPSSTYNKTQKGLPFLQGSTKFGEVHPLPTIYCSEPIKIAEKTDILISVRAPVGEVNISASKVCIGRGLAAIRCNPDKLSYLFLFYCLKHRTKKLENVSAGSTFKAIRKNDIDKLQLPLPPLREQQKTAEMLSTVDQAIEKVGEAIEKTQRLKKGLLHELLNKGLGHKVFKETEIGWIPEGWKIRRVADMFTVESGTTPSTRNKAYWEEGTINWITPTDLSKLNNKTEIMTTERKITEKALNECNLVLMPRG